MTCWDDPEKCHGCHYCQQARDTYDDVFGPIWDDITPLEAHRRDLRDADMAAQLRAERGSKTAPTAQPLLRFQRTA